jgi:phospholipid/cholesterol/gamma-HCH transport system substrate-binding protein
MERNAHYAMVGLVSLILMLGLFVFVVWLARLQFSQRYDVYDIDFKGPVRGLSQGSEVFFNGIKVGEVTRLSLDKVNPNRVMAHIRITSDAPVRVDSVASLEPLGITGVNYVQITAGTPSRPLLKDVVPDNQTPVIRSVRGSLENLLEGGGTVMARAVDALDRVNRMLSDSNLATISRTLQNVDSFTATLKDQKALFADLDATIKSADVSAQKIAKLAESTDNLVNGEAKRTLKNLADAAEELKLAATDARGMVAKLQGPTTDFATTGLPQITASVTALSQAAESLNRMIGDIEQNPRSIFTKPPAKTLEVAP